MSEAQRYLLGEMSEAEREAFSELLLSDPALFAEVEAEEVELLDEYARGEGAAGRRAAVERALLRSPLQRRRLSFSKALIAKPARPLWRYAGLAVAALLCIGAFALVRQRGANLAPSVSSAPSAPVLLAVLEVPPPAQRTSAAIPRLRVAPDGATRVDLRLRSTPAILAGEVDGSLRNGGGVVVAGGPMRRDGETLVLQVARSALPAGSYEFAVLERGSGATLAYSYFIVE